MAEEKKSPPAQQQDEDLRAPAWHDKHGRPELRMPRSFVQGSVEPRVTSPKIHKG